MVIVRLLKPLLMYIVHVFTDVQTDPADIGSPHVEVLSSDDQNNTLLSPPERLLTPLSPTDRSVGNKVLNKCACFMD
jgi:hypothetical protein